MSSEYQVSWLIDDTYQVLKNSTVEYQGSLADCEAYIKLNEGGYF